MPSRSPEKLIRDRIPANAAAEGRPLRVRTADSAEMARLLGLKLVEETHEALQAVASEDPVAVLDELADLHTVIESIGVRFGLSREAVRLRAEEKRQACGGFDSRRVLALQASSAGRLHTGGSATLLDALKREFEACSVARIAVAFVMESGLDLLEGAALAALLRGAEIRFLATDYLEVTEPSALKRLLSWHGKLHPRVFSNRQRSFHPKAYMFERFDGSGRAFIGSANLSRMGLMEGVEWTWTVLDIDAGYPMHELSTRFDELFEAPDTLALSPSWIDHYAARRGDAQARLGQFASGPAPREPPRRERIADGIEYGTGDGISPRPVQQLALDELHKLRLDGQTKALVVAATGLGKTVLAAFDARGFNRVLFVAHRQELLNQAQAAFSLIHPRRTSGMAVAGRLELDQDMVFASVQTLTQPATLSHPALAAFDYVVIDEFHHAAADSYRQLLDHLHPRFLLGLTATPFRGDNRDLLELCGGNLAYQVGLFEAIAFGWLSPFHYYGVADVVQYTPELLDRQRSGYDSARLTPRFNTAERADLAVRHYTRHAGSAALGFCVSIEHAAFMATQFSAAGIPSAAVHSGTDSIDRSSAIAQLSCGALRVLFTVDLFNEGVDIPAVDLVMFLRPTESITVFLQQLGRGLRLHPGKRYLTVLDFIGNYRNAHYKLPLLIGRDQAQDQDPRAALHALTAWQDSGRRPVTLPEGVRRWSSLLRKAHMLSATEQALDEVVGDFLQAVETTSMTKSFKMVVLLAFSGPSVSQFRRSVHLGALVATFREYYAAERHRGDVIGSAVEDVHAVDRRVWARYLQQNPINAWCGSNNGAMAPWFHWNDATELLSYIGPYPQDMQQQQQMAIAVWDRAQARLDGYWSRPGAHSGVYKVIPAGGNERFCVMFGRPRGDLPMGWHLLEINGRRVYGKFVEIALNVVKERPDDPQRPDDAQRVPNILTQELSKLLGGTLGSGAKVRVVKDVGAAVWRILAA